MGPGDTVRALSLRFYEDARFAELWKFVDAGRTDVYLQRINAAGEAQWQTNGILTFRSGFPFNPGGGGNLFVGSKGKLMHETYGLNPRLLPKSLHDSYGMPPKKLPRIATTHEMNWVEAAKGNTEASCPFEYAAKLRDEIKELRRELLALAEA